jgi:hypothetical protein
LPNEGIEVKEEGKAEGLSVPEKEKEIDTTIASPGDCSNYAM